MSDDSDFEPSTIPDTAGDWNARALKRDTRPTAPPAASLDAPFTEASPKGASGLQGFPGTDATEDDASPLSDTPSTQSLTSLELGAVAHPMLANLDGDSRGEEENKTLLSSPQAAPRGAHTTMQSVARPGPPPSQHWDERRVIHLEREVDQLIAVTKLGAKRERALRRQLKWLIFAVALLAAAELLQWLLA